MERKQTHLAYGVVTGIIVIAFSLILYVTGLSFKVPGLGYVVYLILLVGLILNAMAYSKANEGYITFGNAFGSCFKATLIISLFVMIWGIICVVAFPEMKEKAMELARQNVAKNPALTEDQIEMGMKLTDKLYAPLLIILGPVGVIFFGSLWSLIAAAVAPKKGERPFSTADNF